MDDKMFDKLLASTKEAKEILNKNITPTRTFYIEEPSAKDIRKKFNLTQNEFAKLLNISVGTLKNWEQGRRKPKGSASVLLNVANAYPDILMELQK